MRTDDRLCAPEQTNPLTTMVTSGFRPRAGRLRNSAEADELPEVDLVDDVGDEARRIGRDLRSRGTAVR